MSKQKQISEYHDNIVDNLAIFLDRVGYHNVLFPDRLDGNSTKPDLHVPGVAALEIKVISPTIEDYECDEKAAIDLKTKQRYELKSRIKGRSREEDIRKATRQLQAVNENIRILVLASPLNFIPWNRHILEELHGNQYIDYYRTGIIATSSQPYVKSHSTAKLREQNGIDAILLIRGREFSIHNTKLYRVSAHESDIYGKLTTNHIDDFWGYRRGTLL